MNYAKKLEECINFLKQAASDHGYYSALVHTKDQERGDLEHALELAAPTYKERSKLARQLQDVLQERRKAKDIVGSTQAIAEYLSQRPKLLDELGAVLGKLRKEEKYQQERTYTPRVRTDLAIGKTGEGKSGK